MFQLKKNLIDILDEWKGNSLLTATKNSHSWTERKTCHPYKPVNIHAKEYAAMKRQEN
jgi:hypothetical protein